MKIGILSDSHDNLPMIDAAIDAFRQRGVFMVIHAGDFVAPFAVRRLLTIGVPVIGVFGNCDGERKVLSELLPGVVSGLRREKIGGRTFGIIHALAGLRPEELAGLDVVVCGHTHEAGFRGSGPLVINPGECGGWVTGRSTAACIDTRSLTPELIELRAAKE